MKFINILLFLCLSWASSLTPSQGQELTAVSFLPQWAPQAQFAGYYVAYQKKFYRNANLDVNILRGGPDQMATECLENDRVDFCSMFLTTGITKRAQGVKVVNIAQVVQRSALMLVTKKSSGIHSPEDLQGKKVGLWGGDFRVQTDAFFRKYHLSVQGIPQSTSLNLFLRGGVDAASAMWYNEYHTIMNAGIDPDELTIFLLSDHGLNFPEDGLYCMEDTFKKNPTLCCDFAEASIEGWRYAFAHPEEAVDIVLEYMSEAKIASNRAHQRWMLSRMKDIILPSDGGTNMGLLKEEQYLQVAQELERNGFIDRIPDFSEIFRDCGTHAQE